MIPLRDNIPTRRFPIVTAALIAANVVVFLVDWATRQHVVAVNSYGEPVRYLGDIGGISAQYSMIPAAITKDLSHAWITIFISMFLHSNWLHIGGNMLYLWIFGNNVEDTLGRGRYLVFYLACGVIAAACHIATAPQSTTPVVGASGAIAGLMGAYLVLFPQASILTIIPIFFIGTIQEIPALVVIGFWAVLQFLNANWLGGGSMRGGGVAYMAHVGGFLAGVLLILLLGGRRLLEDRRRNDYGTWSR